MQKNKTPKIEDFYTFFEEIAPPIIITEETIDKLKEYTKPLPVVMMDEFITRWEGELDEYTEIVPCFALPQAQEYKALVYWKASLLRYEYIIITLDKSDTLIERKTICGTVVDGDIIKKSVAKIDEDLIIYIQAGASYSDSDFNPESSQSYNIEILESGEMLFHIDEQNQI